MVGVGKGGDATRQGRSIAPNVGPSQMAGGCVAGQGLCRCRRGNGRRGARKVQSACLRGWLGSTAVQSSRRGALAQIRQALEEANAGRNTALTPRPPNMFVDNCKR